MYLLFLRSFFFEDFHAVPLSCIYCPHVHIQSCIAYAEHLAHLFFSCSTFHLWNEKRMSTSQGRFIFHNTDYFLSYHWTFISLFSYVSLSLTLVRCKRRLDSLILMKSVDYGAVRFMCICIALIEK